MQVTGWAALVALGVLVGLWWIGRLPTIQVLAGLVFGYGLANTFVGRWIAAIIRWAGTLAGHFGPGWGYGLAGFLAVVLLIRVAHDVWPRNDVHRVTSWVAILLPSVLLVFGGLTGMFNEIASQFPTPGGI